MRPVIGFAIMACMMIAGCDRPPAPPKPVATQAATRNAPATETATIPEDVREAVNAMLDPECSGERRYDALTRLDLNETGKAVAMIWPICWDQDQGRREPAHRALFCLVGPTRYYQMVSLGPQMTVSPEDGVRWASPLVERQGIAIGPRETQRQELAGAVRSLMQARTEAEAEQIASQLRSMGEIGIEAAINAILLEYRLFGHWPDGPRRHNVLRAADLAARALGVDLRPEIRVLDVLGFPRWHRDLISEMSSKAIRLRRLPPQLWSEMARNASADRSNNLELLLEGRLPAERAALLDHWLNQKDGPDPENVRMLGLSPELLRDRARPFLTSVDSRQRCAALRVMEIAGVENSSEARTVSMLLRDFDAGTRAAAADALGYPKDRREAHILRLLACLNDDNPARRAEAARLLELTRVFDPAALSACVRAVEARNPVVRHGLLMGFEHSYKTGRSVADVLNDIRQSGNPYDRACAVAALREIGK